ncbi:MAG: AtpZ/AtpI family protein [Sciscionella sp.]
MPGQPPRLRDFVALGSAIAGLIIVGLALGWLIDSLVHTFPVFALIGLGLGIVGACVYSYTKFRTFLKD